MKCPTQSPVCTLSSLQASLSVVESCTLISSLQPLLFLSEEFSCATYSKRSSHNNAKTILIPLRHCFQLGKTICYYLFHSRYECQYKWDTKEYGKPLIFPRRLTTFSHLQIPVYLTRSFLLHYYSFSLCLGYLSS